MFFSHLHLSIDKGLLQWCMFTDAFVRVQFIFNLLGTEESILRLEYDDLESSFDLLSNVNAMENT